MEFDLFNKILYALMWLCVQGFDVYIVEIVIVRMHEITT